MFGISSLKTQVLFEPQLKPEYFLLNRVPEGLPSVLAPLLLTSLASVEKPESTTLEDPSGLFRTVRAFGPRESVAFHEPGVSSDT